MNQVQRQAHLEAGLAGSGEHLEASRVRGKVVLALEPVLLPQAGVPITRNIEAIGCILLREGSGVSRPLLCLVRGCSDTARKCYP